MTTVFDASQMNQLSNTFIGVGRNRVINGEMRFDQANGGAAITSNTASTVYGVDQFNTRGTASAGVFTVQRLSATPPTGFQFYSHVVTSTADASPATGSRYLFRSPIETLNIRDFQQGTATAKTFTISFWARSSLTGTFSFSIGGDDGGTGRSFVANYTINNVNTWEYKTITIPGDTAIASWPITNNNIFWLYWDLGCGSTYENTAGVWASSEKYRTVGSTRLISTNAATLDFTGVQLELSPTATPFEFKPLPLEFSLCQRYYEKSYDPDVAPGTVTNTGLIRIAGGQISGGTVNYNDVWFFSPKRVAPTMSFWTNSGTVGQLTTVSQGGGQTNRTPTANGYNLKGWNVICSTTDTFLFGHFTADARL